LFITKQEEVVSETAGGYLKCTRGDTKLPCKILSRSWLFEDTSMPKVQMDCKAYS
jgi:hypothetical protein